MSTVLSFNEFAKGNILNDPKKHALKVDGEDHLKKEKFVDQVKRADLSQELEVNEPDYTKTVDGKKVDEAADIAALQTTIAGANTNINSYNSQIAQKEKELQDLKLKAEQEKGKKDEALGTLAATAATGQAGTSGTSAAPTTQAPTQPTAPGTQTPTGK